MNDRRHHSPCFSAIKSVFVVAKVRRLYPSGVEESIAQSMDENPTNSMANEATKQRFILLRQQEHKLIFEMEKKWKEFQRKRNSEL